jgi:uncharacterized protein YcfJ
MNRTPSVSLLCALLATAAFGAHAETYLAAARVQRVEPQYESVTVPRNECTTQTVTEVQPVAAPPQYAGAVIGGVAGGLLGNQVGRGHGKEAATALGAVVGAFTGDRIANAPQGYQEVPRQVTQCQAVNEVQTRLAGYRVAYEYNGQHYTTFMHDNPGATLQVRVSVDPVTR